MSDFLTTIIASGIGGGLGVAALTAWRTNLENRIARQVEHLSRQIQILYGPIDNLCEVNAGLLARAKQVDSAMHDANSTPPAPVNDDDLTTCTQFKIGYTMRVSENNRNIVRLIIENYPLVDIDDLPTFHKFLLNLQLNEIEWLPNGKTFPPRIYTRMGKIDYSTPGFAELVHKRYVEKTKALAELRNHHSRFPQWISRVVHVKTFSR